MTADQAIVVAVLGSALALFVTGRPRYDVVALLALLAVTVTGVVPADRAFAGFGHPALVTVAAVLVIGRALQNAGLVDFLARPLAAVGKGTVAQVAALSALTALASSVMNSIGALALMLPVALRLTREGGTPPSLVLMPLAFASLLGGLTTLIGTPPNVIISSFRESHSGVPFSFFDFVPVGGAVAAAGVAFLVLFGWRLLPRRRPGSSREDWFQIESYLTELRVPAGSKLVGKRLLDLRALTDVEILVVGIVRDGERRAAPHGHETMHAGDTLLAEVDPKGLERLAATTGVELGGAGGREALGSDDVAVVEAVVTPASPLAGESVRTMRLRERHGLNLVALAREGDPVRHQFKDTHFRPGDVLLLQGSREGMPATLAGLGCLPLAERDLRLGRRPRLALGVGMFAAAIGATSLGLMPAHVTFTAAGVAMLLARLLTLTEAYDAVDWSILVLLGGMLPVGDALEASGGARLIADTLLRASTGLPAAAVLAIILAVTMCLSDVVNNAAAAVIMAPIAIAVAEGLGVSVDPFLMAVAIGASCAFLTPIGHQSNTLVLGPGGYHFGDYWRVGLPLEIVILVLAVPLLLLRWPL